MSESSLKFSMCSFEKGVKKIDNVKCIRVKDKNFGLLIMEDHAPCIGKINGSLTVIGDEELILDHVDGFYLLRSNEFRFIEKGQFQLPLEEVKEVTESVEEPVKKKERRLRRNARTD
ncbi:MAG: hypothetical protein RR428_00260 [Coprobacillus sp.]